MVQLEELPSAPAPSTPSAASGSYGGKLESRTTEELRAEVARMSKLLHAAEERARVRSPLSDVDEEQPAGEDADEDANAGCAAGRARLVKSSCRLTRRNTAGRGLSAVRRRPAWRRWSRTR